MIKQSSYIVIIDYKADKASSGKDWDTEKSKHDSHLPPYVCTISFWVLNVSYTENSAR